MKTSILTLASVLSAAAVPQTYQQQTDDCEHPPAPSLCDKYTTALLKDNTAANQQTVLTLIVNTAIIGNYSSNPGSLVAVPGILAPGTGDYAGVDLSVYFTGALKSTNRGGKTGVSVNLLDGGGAAPLKKNKPADDTTSNQHRLVSHLYPYFAGLLGCSLFGNTTDPYPGPTSMYELHKFMALDEKQIGWFINNVGLSAASFGVTEEDVTTVGKALESTFGMRCSPPAKGPQSKAPELQAICIEPTCPLSTQPVCGQYDPVIEPVAAGGKGGKGGH
ncbi:unnamed protein product [Zymoseptoria tritici ST99CH_3D1]|uniref:Heme haloperoxidase family profile domain-containing protein n=1 Tax=Zymoseptoria tritici ST99CH_1E4 TaxID=1276532 RepID=A0A2H1FWK7_ZYMTR|nr:unnamed protein product [Zymoseptoria tritici ST99CH_1E4]SMR46973.1 unnamed protein product [Zymoseptoria tritici ST99CH_3D1]